jgi:hypothetical protein
MDGIETRHDSLDRLFTNTDSGDGFDDTACFGAILKTSTVPEMWILEHVNVIISLFSLSNAIRSERCSSAGPL